MSNPVIVQGVAVADDGKYQPISHYNNTNDNDTMNYNSTNNAGYYATPSSYAAVQPSNYHAEQLRNAAPQSKQFQDVIWAVLFVAHVCVVAVAILYGIGSSSSTFALSASTTGSIVFVTSVTGLVALGASTAALSFMMQHAEVLVRCALIFSVATSLAMGLLGLLTGNWLLGGMGMLGFLIGICYAKIVWPRIPFAATNLNTALTAVRANMGLLLASFGFTMIAFAWTLAWFLGLSGALASSNGLIVFLLVRAWLRASEPMNERALLLFSDSLA